MRLNLIAYTLLLSTIVFSCRSIRKVTNSDKTTATNTPKKKGDRKFIDGIEVTPGAKVISKHKTTSITTAKKPSSTNRTTGNNIERASILQLKYAVIMDVPVEDLTNIPLLELIDKWWGTKYCMGGSTENCIDCSAFTQVILREIYAQSLPRTSQEQYNMAKRVEYEDLQEGDLVFFSAGGKAITHVGVYLQNNKFVHAST
ncbi:MAG: C40 family peptidase, partial [Chitinophagaceae bacterium]|nr:C40 family peptidase [Chitinophagaceae bacterium]